MDSRPKPSGIGDIFTIEGIYISEIPVPLQVPLNGLSDLLRVGDVVQLSGTGFTELGVPFKIPESQSFRIECPDLIPDGAD